MYPPCKQCEQLNNDLPGAVYLFCQRKELLGSGAYSAALCLSMAQGESLNLTLQSWPCCESDSIPPGHIGSMVCLSSSIAGFMIFSRRSSLLPMKIRNI